MKIIIETEFEPQDTVWYLSSAMKISEETIACMYIETNIHASGDIHHQYSYSLYNTIGGTKFGATNLFGSLEEAQKELLDRAQK